MFEKIERYVDEHFWGSGTLSVRPENEVGDLIKNGAFILDVRTGLEAKKGTAPGATNISVFGLKHHLNELPHDKTIVTYCKSGGRAGKARDILDRNGFKVVNGGSYDRIMKIVAKNEAPAS
jgi:phage shock protein E